MELLLGRKVNTLFNRLRPDTKKEVNKHEDVAQRRRQQTERLPDLKMETNCTRSFDMEVVVSVQV